MVDQDAERDLAELRNWLQDLDLERLLPSLLQFGYNKLSLCTLLDEVTLEEMGVSSLAHRETVLGAVNDLKAQLGELVEYDDGWTSDEDAEADMRMEAASRGSAEMGSTTQRFLSGLDTSQLERSYRESISAEGEDNVMDSAPPVPPKLRRSIRQPPASAIVTEPQYEEVQNFESLPPPPSDFSFAEEVVHDENEKSAVQYTAVQRFDRHPPPPASLSPEEDVFNEEEEKLATGRFLASFSSGMSGAFLADPDEKILEDTSSLPAPPPLPKPRVPGGHKNSPPVPAKNKPPPVAEKPRVMAKALPSAPQLPPTTKPKPSASPRPSKPRPPPPRRIETLAEAKPHVPSTKLPDDLYAKPLKAKIGPPPASKGVTFDSSVNDQKLSETIPMRTDPRNRRSVVDVQDAADVDLDALLADLIDMEKDATSLCSAGDVSQANHRTEAAVSPPSIVNGQPKSSASPEPVIDEDEFSKIMVEMEQLSTAVSMSSAGTTRPLSTNASTLQEEIDRLGGNSKMLNSVNVSSRLSALQDFDLEALNAELNRGAESPMSRTASISTMQSEVRELPNKALVNLPSNRAQTHLKKQLSDLRHEVEQDVSLSEQEKEARIKAMKVQMAVEKLKEAKVQKVALKAYNDDGSSKMIVIDDRMTASEVCSLLTKKNRYKANPNFVLVEQLTESYLERRLEDSDTVVPVLNSWPRESNNSIAFTNRPDKYLLLKRPQLFMPPNHAFAPGSKTTMKESTKRDVILKELFVAQNLPEIESFLSYKEGRKGNWKKHFAILRKSGIYFSTKGKSVAIKDIQRVVDLKDMELYTGHAYRKKYKAPSEYCFSLKPKGPLDITERKIRHFCAESRQEQSAWVQGIRLAKFGNQLLDDYELIFQQMPWLSKETEDEIDGIVQKMQTPEPGNSEKVARGPVQKAPMSAGMASRSAEGQLASPPSEPEDEADAPVELTPWQKQFGAAWKQADLTMTDNPRDSITIKPPESPLIGSRQSRQSAIGLGESEDGMYTVQF